jgi:hypothetical protein
LIKIFKEKNLNGPFHLDLDKFYNKENFITHPLFIDLNNCFKNSYKEFAQKMTELKKNNPEWFEFISQNY